MFFLAFGSPNDTLSFHVLAFDSKILLIPAAYYLARASGATNTSLRVCAFRTKIRFAHKLDSPL